MSFTICGSSGRRWCPRAGSDALPGVGADPSYAFEPRARIAPDTLIPRPSTSTWETVGVPESLTVLMISTHRPMSERKDLFAALVEEHFYDTGWRCSCGWTGSCDEWVDHFASILATESET